MRPACGQMPDNWTDPKAQRCCSIFGVEANFLFGLKALMIQDPINVVMYSFFFSLIQLSTSLQIFEREKDSNFKNRVLLTYKKKNTHTPCNTITIMIINDNTVIQLIIIYSGRP